MIYILLIASLMVRPQPSSFVFVVVATLFNITCGNMDGSTYFIAAALCDFIVTGLLFRFGKSRKALDIMLVSVVSLALNLLGWLMWVLYQPSDLYVGLFGILYATAIVVILKKDGADVGGTALHIDYSHYHPDVSAGCRLVSESEETP